MSFRKQRERYGPAPLKHPFDARESFTPDEIAVRHAAPVEFVFAEIDAGRLRAFRLGGPKGPLRITRESELAWITAYHGNPEVAA